MKLVHTFTPDEQRVVTAAQSKLQQAIEVIAALHQLQGCLALAPDLSGLVAPGDSGANAEGEK